MDCHETCNPVKLMWQGCKRDYQIKSKYAIIFHDVLNITCCKYISAKIKCLSITVIYHISLYFFIKSRTVLKLHNQKQSYGKVEEVSIKFKWFMYFQATFK